MKSEEILRKDSESIKQRKERKGKKREGKGKTRNEEGEVVNSKEREWNGQIGMKNVTEMPKCRPSRSNITIIVKINI